MNWLKIKRNFNIAFWFFSGLCLAETAYIYICHVDLNNSGANLNSATFFALAGLCKMAVYYIQYEEAKFDQERKNDGK